MKKILLISLLLITTGCSEFALLMSGSSVALTQNSYARMYNAVDFGVVVTTKKGIKTHAYHSAKKAWTEMKEGKEYIYDATINLFGNKH